MANDQDPLRETLEELHEQLESAESIDPALQEPLTEILEDVRAALARSDTSAHSGFVALLEQSALEFEATHPTIAGAINRLTHALSSMGI